MRFVELYHVSVAHIIHLIRLSTSFAALVVIRPSIENLSTAGIDCFGPSVCVRVVQ